ncbi:MAG: ribosomal-protein-alanine N-acetyltransferase, partial [Veillonella sp.]|nr:ribosomal-protein-alanine N-acetyltransferase [Veillonella sp.]
MMALRRADIMDVDGIYEVELDSFSIPWSKNAIEEELTDTEGRLYFVAEEDGVVLGYAGAWLVADEGQITNIAV